MNIEKARFLKKVEVDEVSLVKRPATRRKFLIIKENIEMKELIVLLKEFIPESDKIDYDEIEKADIKPEVLKALKSALTTLREFKDAMPPELVSAIAVIAKYAMKSPYPQPYKKSEEETPEQLLECLEKSGRKLSNDMVSRLKAITLSLASLIPEEDDKEKDKDVKKEDVTLIIEEIKKSAEALKTELQTEIKTLGDRVIALEKGEEDSNQLKEANKKKVLKSADDDPYSSITASWFSKSNDGDDDDDNNSDDDDNNSDDDKDVE